jgi:ribonucleoside-triphosphate reductase
MSDPVNNKDHRAKGGNPCLEQTLESYELCCLVETFPNNHTDYEDFQTTLKVRMTVLAADDVCNHSATAGHCFTLVVTRNVFLSICRVEFSSVCCSRLQFAYLYAKTVTLGRTHWPYTNRVMLRNRRIGCSMSGIAQFLAGRGIDELRSWCDKGYAAIGDYDKRFSDWFAIPGSIKSTCIKPSGTVSLVAGGMYLAHCGLMRACANVPPLCYDTSTRPLATGYAVAVQLRPGCTTLRHGSTTAAFELARTMRSSAHFECWLSR